MRLEWALHSSAYLAEPWGSGSHPSKDMPVFLAHIGVGHTMTLLLLSAGAAIVVTNRRARGRERQAQLQHAAYELGRAVALGGTRAEAA